jgi:hypothetical protein
MLRPFASSIIRENYNNVSAKVYWGTLVYFYSGVMQPRLEADHSLSYTAKVKKEWNHTSTPPYTFIEFLGENKPLIYPLNSTQYLYW